MTPPCACVCAFRPSLPPAAFVPSTWVSLGGGEGQRTGRRGYSGDPVKLLPEGRKEGRRQGQHVWEAVSGGGQGGGGAHGGQECEVDLDMTVLSCVELIPGGRPREE